MININQEAIRKATAKAEERKLRDMCLRNGVCPVCSSTLLSTWEEQKKTWFGKEKTVMVRGYSMFSPFETAFCPKCRVEYLIPE